MRALAVHRDVIVVVSGLWQTTCTAVRCADEGFVIDSPLLPDELEALPAVLEQAGFPITGLLATHGDWDHLLGKLAFPGAALGVGESTAKRLAAEPGAAQRALREFDAEWYIEARKPLGLSELQALPVPGRISIGSEATAEIEVHQADGHTVDGAAFWVPWASVLVCGDYLSPLEIPAFAEGGNLEGYIETLLRLAPLVEQAATVVPGHGGPMPSSRAREVLDQDLTYLRALSEGKNLTLPAKRRSTTQKRLHAANVAALS